jgi:hypothetical protein
MVLPLRGVVPLVGSGYAPPDSDARDRHDGFIASNEMLFTPNFLLAPRALSEMNW